jgi:hypothetical protein
LVRMSAIIASRLANPAFFATASISARMRATS